MVCYISTGHLFKLKNITYGISGERNHFGTVSGAGGGAGRREAGWPPGMTEDTRPSPGALVHRLREHVTEARRGPGCPKDARHCSPSRPRNPGSREVPSLV